MKNKSTFETKWDNLPRTLCIDLPFKHVRNQFRIGAVTTFIYECKISLDYRYV